MVVGLCASLGRQITHIIWRFTRTYNGLLATIGWHTLVRVWNGRQVRRNVNDLRTNTTVTTATEQLDEALDEAYVPCMGRSPCVRPWQAR